MINAQYVRDLPLNAVLRPLQKIPMIDNSCAADDVWRRR